MVRPTPQVQARMAAIRLVLMDIDGTLITTDKNSFNNVVEQLRRLKPLNINFSIATGRTFTGSKAIVEQLRHVGMKMPPIINYNGGVMLSGQDYSLLERHLIQKNDYKAAIDHCRKLGLWPIVYACSERMNDTPLETVYVERGTPIAAEFNGMETHVVDNLIDVQDDFVAILVDTPTTSSNASLVSALADKFGSRLRVSTSGGNLVEICHPEGTKLQAMTRLGKLYHIDVSQIMAIGDNLNDLEMIQGAGVGVAVSNAPTQVKNVATFECSRPSAEGVVEALRSLIYVKRHGKHFQAQNL